MKNLADKLKLTGNAIPNSEYNPMDVKFFDQINVSWIDLQSQMLSFESRFEQLNSFNLNASANIANKTYYKGIWISSKFGSNGN